MTPLNMNYKLICTHGEENFAVEVLQESCEELAANQVQCPGNTSYREERHDMPSEGVLIKLAYNPRIKHSCKSIGSSLKSTQSSAELLTELSAVREEKNKLKSLVDDQEDIIAKLEKRCCRLKSESNKMHQEGEKKLLELINENSELSSKVEILNCTLASVKKDFQQKENSYSDELIAQLSVREDMERSNEQGNLENELKCVRNLLVKKENMLNVSNQQLEELKSEICKAKEINDRTISSQNEMENSLNELKEKATNYEAALRKTQQELCQVKKDSERKETCLRSNIEQKEKEIAGLTQENACLKEKLCAQSAHVKTKEQPCEKRNDGRHDMPVHLGNLQECMAKYENKSYLDASQQTVNCESDGELPKLSALQEELERTREALEKEKLESENKCKLISELRGKIELASEAESCKLQELQTALREKEQSERSMKLSFCQQLRWQEEELSKQLEETHHQLMQYESSMNMGNECTEHVRMLEQLEQEVETKTAEWQEYVKRLTRERNDAIRAARFASQKLMSYVADFQRHMAIQRRVQQMLTEMLHRRESELKNTMWKMSKLKADALNSAQNSLLTRKY
ncbi:uncharacterized protein [Hetaerina americana]|uniref:uncharacterized protein n=1 Tax=Hetaerina americana TaxID=62018 RepID=UPI003A7F3237